MIIMQQSLSMYHYNPQQNEQVFKKKLVLRERIQRLLHKLQKGEKPIYGYKSRGYFESSPDEGKQWPRMDFCNAGIILFLDLGTSHSCSPCINSCSSSLMVYVLFCISDTSKQVYKNLKNRQSRRKI